MKKYLIIFFILLCNFAYTQNIMICGNEESNGINRHYGNIAYGGIFTPKGDMRILVVFVKFKPPYDTFLVANWPINQNFPNWAIDETHPSFDTSFNHFSNNIFFDTNRFSVSNLYYQMSNGSFRLIADYYPNAVEIDIESGDNWTQLNTKTINKIKNDVEWSKYDKRTRRSYYQSDDSQTIPDYNIDYVMICYRFEWDWNSQLPSNLSNNGANAFSSLSGIDVTVGNGYHVKDGFTLMTGASVPIGVFSHELGHELYSGPHYNGGNGVCGKYFYMPASGWGMMNIGFNYTCALGWERFILDWTPQIKASNIPADIDDPSDLVATNGVFTLRDFITTGDATRIKIPAANGKHQYLWLENHQGISVFDGFLHGSFFCEYPIEEYKRGLVAYVEGYSHAKEETNFNLFSNGNAIHWLTKNGDYDFSYVPIETQYATICNNISYPLYTIRKNPVGGQSVNDYIREDFNCNGFIKHNGNNMNNPGSNANERAWAVEVNNETPTARWMTGSGMQFHEGDKVGMATNPTIKNMPEYDETTYTMGDYYLNGISFEVLSENADGSMTVKIRLDDVAVDRDVRWAARSIVLGDITGDSRPDVDVQPNIKLTIDMSGTPNRHKNPDNPNHTPSVVEDFITPTTFTCRSGSYFKQEPYSAVEVLNKSALVLEAGSVYEVGDHASLSVGATGTLIVKSGATLRVSGSGHVDIADGAYICLESGAMIDLVDEISTINLSPQAASGIYTESSAQTCNCTTTPLVFFPLTASSSGRIHQCSGDNIVTSVTYTGNEYICGDRIYAGRLPLPNSMSRPSDVIVANGARVVLDANRSVKLEPGFKVNLGGRIEVR